jgi:D-alanyl-D-alanine dipeptidase
MLSKMTMLIAFCCMLAQAAPALALPQGFVYADEIEPSLIVEMRYFGEHNFVGAKVDGYKAPRCILTKRAADALKNVQRELLSLNLSLKVYDCYRPVRAVKHFMRWAKDLTDTKTKAEFYPTLIKEDLFKLGYVAERSSHNRGSTVDLTIVPLPAAPQPKYRLGAQQAACFAPAARRYQDNSLDMGVGFDCFHELSHTKNPRIGGQQRANRALLWSLMDKHGFENYAKEWWHFTLRDEPHPGTYFDFPVE